MKEFRDAGVNRLSIGVQSFNSLDLAFLDRGHSEKEAIDAISIARGLFRNISIDLIFGTPNHFQDTIWKETLETALSLDVDHISLYQLSIEKGTKLARDKSLIIPSQEETYDLYNDTIISCEKKGLMQYETSNFGKVGKECRHNINYWKCRDYIGFGPGAHSRVTSDLNDRRALVQIHEPNQWLSSVLEDHTDGNIRNEPVSPSDRLSELLLMGLRMNRDGIDLKSFELHCGKPYHELLKMNRVKALIENDLLIIDDEKMKTTRKGAFVLNLVLKELF